PNARIILHQNLSASFDENLEKSAFDILRAYGIEIV
ncbi:hydrolase, partial [Campylobacter jejuni]